MKEHISSEQGLKESLDRLRRRLLDLSRRNPLLNYRFPKRSIKIIDELPSATFHPLLTGRRFTLTAIEESQKLDSLPPQGLLPARIEDVTGTEDLSLSIDMRQELPIPGETIDAKHLDDLLQTPFNPKELERRCTVLHTTARTALEETGTNFLHLAIGFLEWFESDDSTEKSRAPLILVPLEINKGKHDPWTDTFQYSVNYSEEDIETNLSLAEKLAQDFRIDLPEFDSERDPEEYLTEVSEKILSYPRWRVVREMVIDLFSFSKLLMYRELNQNHGSEAQHPAEHPIVSKLLGDTEAPSDNHTDLQLAEIYNVDRHPQAHEIQLVMDADSSQHSALIDALAERKNLVIHGPPGTGKSQTITNLIAAALANGKSILFVAEKSAALEVVKNRLDRCGLGDFVLELHSRGTNKGQLHQELERRLHKRFPEPRDIKEQETNLTQERLRLLSYTEAAQMLIGPDQEPFFKVAFRASRFRTLAKPEFPESNNGEFPLLSRREIEERTAIVREASMLWHDLPDAVRLAWDGIDLRHVFGSELQSVSTALRHLHASAIEAQAALSLLTAEGAPISTQIVQLRGLVQLSLALSSPSRPHLAPDTWANLLSKATADKVRKLHDRLAEIPALTKASATLPQTQVCLDLTFVAGLKENCARLIQEGHQEKTLYQLETLLQSSQRCAHSAQQLQHLNDTIHNVLGASPSFLADFEKVISLAELFSNMPQLVERAFEPAWLRRHAEEKLRQAEETAQQLTTKLREVQRRFDTKFAPYTRELRLIAKRLRSLHDRWFPRLRSEYRVLHKEIVSFLHNPKEVRDRTLTERIEQLANLLDDVERFASDVNIKDALGHPFKGIETDWPSLRATIAWTSNLIQTVRDPLLAKSLVTNTDNSANEIRRLGNQLSQPLVVLYDGLRECGLGDSLESPITLIQQLLAKQLELLEGLLLTLRAAQAPRLTTVEQLQAAAAARLQLLEIRYEVEANQTLAISLGNHWQGFDTDTTSLLQALDWLSTLHMTGVQADVISWALSGPESPRGASIMTVSDKLKQFLSVREEWLKQCSRWGGVNLERWLKGKSPSFILADVIQACEASLATIEFLNPWSEFCRVTAHLQELGHQEMIQLVHTHNLAPERLAAYFRALAYEAIARQAVQANPALANFTRVAYERTIREFQRIDRELNSRRGQDIASNIAKRPIPAGIGTGPVRTLTNRGLIEHELSKKTRHIPIRQLVRRAGKALQAIKPCFMMSPLSVAQYLPPGQIDFDLVVMDEASQVKPEDALGAILRGKQVVIVGDPKQLPPTTFFDQISDAEEDDEEHIAAEETESILEIAQRTFANRTLLWHYRSQHPSLIAFSNSQFYNNELLLFPSPYAQHNEFGVQVHWIEDATYKNSRNLVEALQVAQAVRTHLIEQPEVSLGVATMNSQQRDLILAEIERLQKTDARFDVTLRQQEERDEPFFVKNLENVQGDEREVIFISTTYGRDPETQRVYQRFGPIARDKGWRRLNVLFTRARRRIELFTSLKSNDIVLGENPSRGVVAFRNYLAFAETGQIVEIGLDSGRSPDSDFEVDVATLLIAHGYQVEAQVGVAGFFIDLGVKDSQDAGTYRLGIECDGATYHSAKSVRDRDRLRQEILEAKGWKIHRIWSTDWFKNRESEIQRLLSVVAGAARTTEELKCAIA